VDKVGDIPLNHARIEEIVSYDPDLILAYELSDRRLVSLLQKLGYRVAVVPSAQSLDDVGEIIVEVAALLDERDRGKQLRAAMLRDLQRLSAQDFQQRPLAVIYAPNGYSPGTHTLQGSILDAAGFENISARLGNAQGAAIPLEQILRHQPDLFIIDDEESNAHSLAQKKLTHPALAKSIDRSAMAHINGRFWSCPTPMVVEAVGRLRGYH
jgi:iron complex transport system substrate-binding protein